MHSREKNRNEDPDKTRGDARARLDLEEEVVLVADSGRYGFCPGCGHAIRWWDSPNGRTIAIDPQSRPHARDFSRKQYLGRSLVSFLSRDLHRLHCPARARYRLPRRRSSSAQINLPVDC